MNATRIAAVPGVFVVTNLVKDLYLSEEEGDMRQLSLRNAAMGLIGVLPVFDDWDKAVAWGVAQFGDAFEAENHVLRIFTIGGASDGNN